MAARITPLILGLALVVPGSVRAQEGMGSIGLGVGISSSVFSEAGGLISPTVYVPIMSGDKLMIEPGVGLLRASQEEVVETALAIQVGLLFMVHGGAADRIYVGPRIGILRTSLSADEAGVDESNTDLALAGVAGGEFFLRDRFSLGGEVGLSWLDAQIVRLLTTIAEFRVRWYFAR